MYYVIFEAIPYEGKAAAAGAYYKSLLPHLNDIVGFRRDSFLGSVNNPQKAVNIAEWDDLDAVARWRNEEHHLRAQEKGGGIYESYRIRIGGDDIGSNDQGDQSHIRHYATLYYPDGGEGALTDDVTELLDASDATDLKKDLIDSAVYRAQDAVWVCGWRSHDAAVRFEKLINQKKTGRTVQIQISRDYTKLERKDAPHETAGAKL